MSNARFWFVPLKDIAPAEQQAQLGAKDDVRASDLPASFNVPSKLCGEGIRAGHVLALHDGDTVTSLARVLALDSAGSLLGALVRLAGRLYAAQTGVPADILINPADFGPRYDEVKARMQALHAEAQR